MSLLETIEAALKSVLQPARAFEEAKSRPEAGYGTSAANLLFWSALALLLNVVGAFLRFPEGMGLGVAALAAAVAVGALTALLLSFPAAALLRVLTALSGGGGSLRRSYETLSMLSALAPASALFVWLPSWTWVLPTFYATYAAATALHRLHEAPQNQAWTVLGFLAILASAGQVAAHRQVLHLQQRIEAGINLSATVSAAASAASEASPQDPMAAAAAAMQQAAAAMEQAGISSPSSGLDLIRSEREGGSPGPAAPPGGAQPSVEQLRGMGLKMLDDVNRRFSDERVLNAMSPEQAAQVRAMLKTANEIGAQVRSGQAPQDPDEFARRMMQVMGSYQMPGAADTAPRVKRGRKVRPPK